ncbi:hypothetical protein [Nocardiopsis sp. LOL_012]|uniref:hypothetical protein n=1 Tax=Nocardiopsis sp. LOL_012 TaxID=3345409 RepID=UPI003A894AF3
MEGVLSAISLAAVVLAAAAIVFGAHFPQNRAAWLRAWARNHGWHYSEHRSAPLDGAHLPHAIGGRGGRSRHVLTGRRGGHEVTVFEHTHTHPASAPGDRRHRHTYRIVAVRTPGPNAELEIRRRDPFRSTEPGSGLDAVFDETFHTSGSDIAFTRAVLRRRVTDWLLADPRSRSLPVRFSGDHVLTWATTRLDPDRALTAADYLIDLVGRVPPAVWTGRPTSR